MKRKRTMKAWAFVVQPDDARYAAIFTSKTKKDCKALRDMWNCYECTEIVPIAIPLRGKVRK